MGAPQRGAGPSPEPARRAPKNRWWRDIDRSPRVGTAAAGFGAYLIGALLLIVSVFLIIPGILLVVGSMGSGWQGRIAGVGLIVVGAAALVVGRWLSDQYAV